MPVQRFAAISLALLLAGCAATPQKAPVQIDGAVGYKTVVLGDVERLEIEPARFVNADPPVGVERVLPVYPLPRLQQKLPPIKICAELWIDAQGVVYNVVPVVQAPECPAVDVPRADFDAAVATAVRQWPFLPAFVCEDSADGQQDLDCHGNGRQRYIPIRNAYQFVFTQTERGGEVVVHATR